MTVIIESQKSVYLLFPLFPIFIIFFIGCVAETNRAPFDLAEAIQVIWFGLNKDHNLLETPIKGKSAGINNFIFIESSKTKHDHLILY